MKIKLLSYSPPFLVGAGTQDVDASSLDEVAEIFGGKIIQMTPPDQAPYLAVELPDSDDLIVELSA